VSVAPLQTCCAPFDAVAERYDEIFTQSRIGTAQRLSVWKELENTFHGGDHVIEIGCGTGVDACFLAERGVKVVASDSSRGMLEVAGRRIASLKSDVVEIAVNLRLLPAENLAALRGDGPFDGAFSNFGAVNCVQDLGLLAKNLHDLLKPGANVLLCLLGPCCLWEIGWYLTRGNPQKAFRRLRSGGTTARIADGEPVTVHYPSVRSLVRTFAPHFRLRFIKGVGVLVPPSYLESWANRFPSLLDFGVQADALLERCPGIRQLADHVLLKFERGNA
jgi:SAM-dependent methyltransferase